MSEWNTHTHLASVKSLNYAFILTLREEQSSHFASTDCFRFLMDLNAPSSFLIMYPMSSLQAGHCSAMAHRASSTAPCVCWSGSVLHWASMPSMSLSQPSSLTRVVIQGWARMQPPRAWRLNLQSSEASSQLSAQLGLTLTGPGLEPESRALRRKRRAVEKKRLWPASTEPGGKKNEKEICEVIRG